MPRCHVYVVSCVRQTVTLFNASDSSSRSDGSASLFPSHGILAYNRRNGNCQYRDKVGKCRCPMRGAERSRECKPYTVFTAEQRATIGKYASEHGNTTAVKFKANIEGGQLGESVICLLKKHYFEELTKAKHSGATVPEVKSIASRERTNLT